MIFLFQVVDSTKVVDKAFQIDPTNIFQFLVGGLVVIIVTLIGAIIFLQKRLMEREKRLEELTVNITTVAVNTTSVLDSLVGSVDLLPVAIEKHKAEIKEVVKTSETAILRTIDQLKKR